MRVRNRLQSGILEVMFKEYVADKTNWRGMLKGVADPLNLNHEASLLIKKCRNQIKEYEEEFGSFGISILKGVDAVDVTYPIEKYPEKVISYNFDKEPEIEDKLVGIKGQYLIFEHGVINLRKYSGYEVRLSC